MIPRLQGSFITFGQRLQGFQACFSTRNSLSALGTDLVRSDLERLGFYVCVEDLEDELIRALGPAAVERVVEAHGDLGAFRTLQKQPAWQDRALHEQLRRFMGSGGSRKIRYARYLVDALDLTGVPRPLDQLLRHV